MADLKLTVDQLKNYLGTGLKSSQKSTIGPLIREMDHLNMYSFISDDTRAKLMFYRLSDLDKFIPELGFVPIKRLPYSTKLYFYRPLNPQFDLEIIIQTEDYSQEIDLYDGFKIMSLLFQWHFWPFGDEYFDAGLVIDKMREVGNE